MEPVPDIAHHDAPRAVLGSEPSRERDVGPAEALPRLAEGLADEGPRHGGTVPDGRFRDRDRDWKKSVPLVEEAAQIEPAVIRRANLRRRRRRLRGLSGRDLR